MPERKKAGAAAVKPRKPKPANENDEGAAEDGDRPFGAHDADWREGDHPRAQNGQFGSGGGGKASSERQTLRMPQFGLTPRAVRLP